MFVYDYKPNSNPLSPMPNKCRRLNQPVYMSTRSKQNARALDAHWSASDEADLLAFLESRGVVEGGNYKPQVWNEAVSKMRKPPEKGAPKTATSCKSKWGRVSQSDHLSDLCNSLLLDENPVYECCCTTDESFWGSLDPENGIVTHGGTPAPVTAVWDDYTSVGLACYIGAKQ